MPKPDAVVICCFAVDFPIVPTSQVAVGHYGHWYRLIHHDSNRPAASPALGIFPPGSYAILPLQDIVWDDKSPHQLDFIPVKLYCCYRCCQWKIQSGMGQEMIGNWAKPSKTTFEWWFVDLMQPRSLPILTHLQLGRESSRRFHKLSYVVICPLLTSQHMATLYIYI